MLALALAAAMLAVTGWLAMIACVVLALVQNDIHNQHQRQLSENANWRSRPQCIDLNYA